MNKAFGGIEEEALKLPARLRARLARELILSLDDTEEEQAEVEEALLVETKRRSVELESGRIKRIPAEKVSKSALGASMTIVFHPLAERELTAAAKFYEERLAGLWEQTLSAKPSAHSPRSLPTPSLAVWFYHLPSDAG